MDLFGKKAAAEVLRLQGEICQLEDRLNEALQTLESLGYNERRQLQKDIDDGRQTLSDNAARLLELEQRISELSEADAKLSKQIESATKKLDRIKELYKSTEYALNKFFDAGPSYFGFKIHPLDARDIDQLVPSVALKLHAMDVPELRKAFRENDKQIEKVLSLYATRYTTKANQSIYKLMVIALRAELQNVLYALKFEKLDAAIDQVKDITAKYRAVACEGNQSIAETLTTFIGQIEYLFINAVKIEYNYYVKKEQARQEQLALREQMRQEAAERKALEEERKAIEREESKYTEEIKRIQEQAANADDAEAAALKKRIADLEAMLSDVHTKKESIVNLQNGKAGNVYIISNLGSFGEHVFKIGMTRRLDPQERIDELSNASVPFSFDVHSFIFSEDAVALESQLHQALDASRVNKVNRRKEFFYADVDQLEKLVAEIDPTAEFNKTMLAEDFKQSISLGVTDDDDDQ